MTTAHRYSLPAVLTHREAPQVLREMAVGAADMAAAGAGCWTVEASALTEFDSSALAVLIGCKRLASVANCDLVIVQPPPKLVQLAGLYGLDEVLLGEAIASREASQSAGRPPIAGTAA